MDASEAGGNGFNGGARVLVTGGALTVTVTRDNGPHADSELESESAVDMICMRGSSLGRLLDKSCHEPCDNQCVEVHDGTPEDRLRNDVQACKPLQGMTWVDE